MRKLFITLIICVSLNIYALSVLDCYRSLQICEAKIECQRWKLEKIRLEIESAKQNLESVQKISGSVPDKTILDALQKYDEAVLNASLGIAEIKLAIIEESYAKKRIAILFPFYLLL